MKKTIIGVSIVVALILLVVIGGLAFYGMKKKLGDFTEEEIQAAINSKIGDDNYRAELDLNNDGVIDSLDLILLSNRGG